MKKSMLTRSARGALALGLMSMMLASPGTGRAGGGQEAGEGGNVTSNWVTPFQGSYSVDDGTSSEIVDFSGSAHLVVKFSAPTDPCASCVPPNPVRIHTNLVSVSGVGRASGRSYRLAGAANFELDADAGSVFEFVGSYRLTPVDPCKGCTPTDPCNSCPAGARFLPVRYVVTLNPAGEVTEATAGAGGPITVDSE